MTLYYPKGKISAGVAISSPEGERKRKKRVEGFPFLSFPKFFIGNPNAFKTLMDPGLKIAGVTRRWESKCFETRGPLIETFRGDGKEERRRLFKRPSR